MGYEIEGRTALVTGGSSGIGAALAEALAREGATVGICARRSDRLRDVLDRCQVHSPASKAWTVDLADLDGLDGFAARADDELGGIDLLVHNAGIPKRRHVVDLTPDVVERVMAINYFSPVRLTLALLPRMLERGAGRIVHVASVAARLSPPHEAAYAASKSALATFAESMAVDLSDTPVRIHVVHPGVIDTELFHLPDNEPSMADVPAERPEAMAAAIIDQLREDAFERYFPSWFAEVAEGKARDVGAFLAGSAAWVRERQSPPGAPPAAGG